MRVEVFVEINFSAEEHILVGFIIVDYECTGLTMIFYLTADKKYTIF